MALKLKGKKRGLTLMGKKRGMVQLFDEKGHRVVCTVIEAEPNVITQIKTKESDGYSAIQLGFEKIEANDPRTVEKRAKKPLVGHFKKAGVEPRRYLIECRLEEVENYQLGQEIPVSAFSGVAFVDVTGRSKGKGYQGLIKKNNYAGGPAAHGSGFHRHAGSTGMRSTPGRCLPGGPRPSHMGDERVTVQNLRVVMVREEDNLIVVEGQIPGPREGVVRIREAVKKPSRQSV
jgi:large subunit ribosomal protein L3